MINMTLIVFLGLLIFIPFIILAISADNKNNDMNNHNSAKYAFYYLLSLVALIFTALSVGMIAFSIIDKSVGDALNYSSVDGQLKFAISALFISGPIFYLMSFLINKGLQNGELDKESGVRRWLTYFIILVSSLIILGVFIGIMTSFLSGELTTSFILKSLTMIVIAAAVFSFYFYDIKRAEVKGTNTIIRIFFISSASLVLIAFVAAWFFVESPRVARAKRLDQVLINNISSLESAVNSYYEKTKVLPDNLDQIKNSPELYIDMKSFNDPETGAPIVYNKTSTSTFEFCANFRTDTKNTDDRNAFSYAGPNKLHLSGYQCLKGELWPQAIPAKF